MEKMPSQASPENKREKSINEQLKERGIDAPPIEFKIAYTTHATAEDANFLEPGIREADIFFPELYGLDDSEKAGIQAFVNGEMGLDELKEKFERLPLRSPFGKRLFEVLEGSQKKIMFADLAKESDLEKKVEDNLGDVEMFIERCKNKKIDFESARHMFVEEAKKMAELQREREGYIRSRMPDEFERILREHPDLLKRDTIKAFGFFGSFHTGIYHDLKSAGNDIAREFPSSEYTYSYDTQLLREAAFKGYIDTSNEEIITRALFERFIDMTRLSPRIKFERCMEYKRTIAEAFSIDEIREIYEMYIDSERKEFQAFLDEKIKDKGLLPVEEWLELQEKKEE